MQWIETNGPDTPIEEPTIDEDIPLDDKLNAMFEAFATRGQNLGISQ